MQKKAEISSPYKESAYEEFIRWTALPSIERVREGVSNQGEFADKHGLNKDTLTRWKNRPDFEARVDKLLHRWGFDKTPTVIEAIRRSAVMGDAKSQKLWIEKFTNFGKNRAAGEVYPTVTPEDVRGLIISLPQDLQNKYRAMLDDLIYDVKAFDEGRLDDMTNSPNNLGL